MNLIEYSFLLKPFIAGLWLGVVFSLLGIFVLIRRMTFFSDGIAHAAILGLAVAFLLNLDPILISLITSIFLSFLIYFLERKTKIHTDTLIGLIFVTSLSLGLILVSKKSGYQPELLNFLIGNILTITDFEFFLSIIFSIFVLTIMIFYFFKFIFVFVDPTEARLRRLNVNLYEIIFYFILGMSVILGIKLVGIVLVTSFLVLPPAISVLISRSLKELVFFSVLFSLLNVIIGFFLSIFYNFPLGASITLSGSVIFFLIFLFNFLFKNFD